MFFSSYPAMPNGWHWMIFNKWMSLSTNLVFSDEKPNQLENVYCSVVQAFNPYSIWQSLLYLTCAVAPALQTWKQNHVFLYCCFWYSLLLMRVMLFSIKYSSLLRFIQAGTLQLWRPLVITISQVIRLPITGWGSHHLGLLAPWSTVLLSSCLSRRETASSQGSTSWYGIILVSQFWYWMEPKARSEGFKVF